MVCPDTSNLMFSVSTENLRGCKYIGPYKPSHVEQKEWLDLLTVDIKLIDNYLGIAQSFQKRRQCWTWPTLRLSHEKIFWVDLSCEIISLFGVRCFGRAKQIFRLWHRPLSSWSVPLSFSAPSGRDQSWHSVTMVIGQTLPLPALTLYSIMGFNPAAASPVFFFFCLF